MTPPPLLVLGVRRSGTTLLRVMLDRHPDLAVPDESYFIPQLADRQPAQIDVDAFIDDLRRLPTIRDWAVPLDEVRARLRPGMPLGQAIGAVYETYAARHGKSRWGDKTPMYMQRLPLLERLFPDARYVHLIRDGRDTRRLVPLDAGGDRHAHMGAPGDGRCVRLPVAGRGGGCAEAGRPRRRPLSGAATRSSWPTPSGSSARICELAGLEFDPAMLEYAGRVDVSRRSRTSRA